MKRIAMLVTAMIAACAWKPASNPQSAEYPCGPRGVVCSGIYPNASCCWLGDVCGSGAPFSTCPAGYCCAEGVDEIGADRVRRAQWTPQ